MSKLLCQDFFLQSSPMSFLSDSHPPQENVHLQVVKVVVPSLGAVVLMLTIICLLLRRKRQHSHRPVKAESPIAWLPRFVLC